MCSFVQESTCQNHVRVYESIPSDPTLFLVCGTQASVAPECRTIRVSKPWPLTPIAPMILIHVEQHQTLTS